MKLFVIEYFNIFWIFGCLSLKLVNYEAASKSKFKGEQNTKKGFNFSKMFSFAKIEPLHNWQILCNQFGEVETIVMLLE